jgi:glycosyltransferase involved in cell wall biosynthesis
MKTLHLSYADGGGGAAKAAYRIHRGVHQLGVDSSMLVSKRVTNDSTVLDPGSPQSRWWAQSTPYVDLLPWKLLKVSRRGFSSLAWAGTGMLGRIKALQPDIVHLHWICGGCLRVEDLGRLDYPVVWRLADMWPMAGAEHYLGNDLRYRQGYRRDNRPPGEKGIDLNRWVWERKKKAYAQIGNLTIVAPSRWLAACARASVLLGDRRIEVIPTGQDIETFRPLPKHFARELLRLPTNAKFIMAASMGLDDPRKGVSLLLEALESLRGHGYELLLLGDKPASNSFPLPTRWLGKFNDDVALALAYSAADVFVAPSIEENLANTVIEAMACGIPCVAFDIGGMPDIIHHEKNGYLATPFEIEDLARGIVGIMGAGEAYGQLAAEARFTVEREFSQELQARRYLRLYEELMAQV